MRYRDVDLAPGAKVKGLPLIPALARAVREERKNVTRRVKTGDRPPYAVGDVLYVREGFAYQKTWDKRPPRSVPQSAEVFFRADGRFDNSVRGRWRPPMFMPKRIARTWLRVQDVQAERLLDITHSEVLAEGLERAGDMWRGRQLAPGKWSAFRTPDEAFFDLWDHLHAGRHGGAYVAEKNPEVWVIRFVRCGRPR